MIAIDLGMYFQHRLFRAIPLLWRAHQIHHCDLDVDCGTALRHHPIEVVLAQAFDLAFVVAVGIPPLAVLAGVTLAGAAALFNHANIALPQAAERSLRWFVVTPDMHRIHSAEMGESDTNFANLIPWWDRLFATHTGDPQLGHARMMFGLAEARGDKDFSLR